MPTELSNPEKLSLLLELSLAFGELRELDELLVSINARTREVLDAESCAILLLDEQKNELFFPVSRDLTVEMESRFREIRFPADQGIAGWVLKNDEPALVTEAQSDPRFYPAVDRQSGAQTRDLLYAPLRTRRGVIGVVGVRNKRHGSFTEEDRTFLAALAGGVAVAIDNARFYEQLKASEQSLRTEVGALRRDLARRERFTEIVGTTAAMAEVFELMESAAAAVISVLIEGETGTGKELVARAIHRESDRRDGPFLAINCAAVPENLLESELFGYRRGAFTGAAQDKRGLLEAANQGTLFLDEVGEMAASMQAKLLRVLQEGEVTALGDTRPRKIDIRLISATNRDLAAEVAASHFRQDLFYRVAAFPISLPPLRERREDIPILAQRILLTASERNRKTIRGIDPAANDLLVGYEWPGNVRELQNEIERAVALTRDGEAIGPAQLSAKLRTGRAASAAAPARGEIAAREAVDVAPASSKLLREGRAAFEAQAITAALKECEGRVSHAARALGMSRVTLYKKMKDYGLR